MKLLTVCKQQNVIIYIVLLQLMSLMLATNGEFAASMKMLDLLTREPVNNELPVCEPEIVSGPKIEQVQDESKIELIFPYDDFHYTETETLFENSYVIENKRFIEDLTIRCKESTIPKNVMESEPTVVIVNTDKPDVRIKATVSAQVVIQAGFDPTKNTTIQVHGFTQSYPQTPYLRRVRQLATQNRASDRENLIFFDYGRTVTSGYAKSCAASAVASSFLASFAMKLIELGADRRSIHLVGHSLGGQVVGLAAKKIRPPIGRVTAIDAAGPCFGKLWPDNRHSLAANDAEQVVVLHYDDRVLGVAGQHGNIDVYVNGGSLQPGCGTSLQNVVFQAAVTSVLKLNRPYSPAHTRSALLASSNLGSINSCQHVAYQCRDYESFKRGECGQCDQDNSQCFFMDFLNQFSDLPLQPVRPPSAGKTKFYISTGQNEPYCSNHFQILVELATISTKFMTITNVHLELTDENGQVTIVGLTNQLESGVFSHLLLTESAPARFERARLRVFEKAENVTPLLIASKKITKEDLNSDVVVNINFMSNIDFERRRAFSTRLCMVSEGLTQDGSLELSSRC